MTPLLKRSVSLLLLILLSACANMQVSDWRAYIVLPATGDCYGINVVSRKETRIPRDQCVEIAKRGIILTSENYKMLREDIQTNCQMSECTQLIGRFDNLFIAIDKGLQQIP